MCATAPTSPEADEQPTRQCRRSTLRHAHRSRPERADPYPSMTPSYWATQKDAPELSLAQIGLPLDVDTSMLSQLPVFSSGTGSENPPPPPVKFTPGSNPALAVNELEKYPEQILSAVRLGGISIVTVKASVVEFAKDLAGVQIPSWPKGDTWDKAPGGFFEGGESSSLRPMLRRSSTGARTVRSRICPRLRPCHGDIVIESSF
jgi:hypothetical protein